ncbi:ATP-binding cassette domain-containing protein, partial [Mycobacterium kiyosense]
VQLTRSRISARRLQELAPRLDNPDETSAVALPRPSGRLSADVRCGHPGTPGIRCAVDVVPGARLAVTGASGSGKTTLLMTLAGLLPPLQGRVTLNGVDVHSIREAELRSAIVFFAEDAHLFTTTVRDNLLVARGDCTDEELTAALTAVGLGDWLAGLPEGLSTVLVGGAQAVSAGQRRRLLLARALLSPARILLLDEPTEHLDRNDAEDLLRGLLAADGALLPAARTVVVATHHLPRDIDCEKLDLTSGVDAA